jgi:hypothetical protein
MLLTMMPLGAISKSARQKRGAVIPPLFYTTNSTQKGPPQDLETSSGGRRAQGGMRGARCALLSVAALSALSAQGSHLPPYLEGQRRRDAQRALLGAWVTAWPSCTDAAVGPRRCIGMTGAVRRRESLIRVSPRLRGGSYLEESDFSVDDDPLGLGNSTSSESDSDPEGGVGPVTAQELREWEEELIRGDATVSHTDPGPPQSAEHRVAPPEAAAQRHCLQRAPQARVPPTRAPVRTAAAPALPRTDSTPLRARGQTLPEPVSEDSSFEREQFSKFSRMLAKHPTRGAARAAGTNATVRNGSATDRTDVPESGAGEGESERDVLWEEMSLGEYLDAHDDLGAEREDGHETTSDLPSSSYEGLLSEQGYKELEVGPAPRAPRRPAADADADAAGGLRAAQDAAPLAQDSASEEERKAVLDSEDADMSHVEQAAPSPAAAQRGGGRRRARLSAGARGRVQVRARVLSESRRIRREGRGGSSEESGGSSEGGGGGGARGGGVSLFDVQQSLAGRAGADVVREMNYPGAGPAADRAGDDSEEGEREEEEEEESSSVQVARFSPGRMLLVCPAFPSLSCPSADARALAPSSSRPTATTRSGPRRGRRPRSCAGTFSRA